MARQPPFEAYQGNSPFVFVSYAHAEADWVYAELQWLHDQNVNIWYDEGIAPGSDWSAVLAESIGGCDGVLFFVGEKSANSENVANEINFALDAGKPVTAIYDDEVTLPPGLKFSLSRQQAVIRSNLGEKGYKRKLLQAVENMVGGTTSVDVSNPVPGFLGRAAIAVMSFKGQANDEDGSYFAEGLTEELITTLQSWRTIPVIASESTRSYDGDEISLRRLALELGVGYVLRGSVRQSGKRLRISVQLTDTISGHHIWAERFDGLLEDIFDLQDEITQRIIAAIEPEVLEQEMDRSNRVPTEDLRAWDLYLRGLARYQNQTKHDLMAARQLWEEACTRDPALVHAVAGRAVINMYLLLNHRSELSESEALEARESCRELAEEAMRLDHRALPALTAQMVYLIQSGEYDQALSLTEEALELYPASASTWFSAAYASMRSGRFEQALDQFSMVKRLSPRDPNMWQIYNQEGACYFWTQQFEKALPLLNRSIALKRDHLWPHMFRTLSLNILGRKEDAQKMLEQFLNDVPDFNADQLLEIDQQMAEPLLAGLRDAGWTG
ncbi:MAG: TIR domain-containing protein [Gammaproteobacteria bacterium]